MSGKRIRSMSEATDRQIISKEGELSCLRFTKKKKKKKKNLCFNQSLTHHPINGLFLGELILVELYDFMEHSYSFS